MRAHRRSLLTVLALGSLGLKADVVARRMTSFETLLYCVYMGALVIFGMGLPAVCSRGLRRLL